MKHEIRCKVYPGQFSSEFAVKAVQANGKGFSLFAPLNAVTTEEPTTRDRAVDGWLKVDLWELLGDRAIVYLPRESFEAGYYVTMSVGSFKVPPAVVEAG